MDVQIAAMVMDLSTDITHTNAKARFFFTKNNLSVVI